MALTHEIIKQHNLTEEEYQRILAVLSREPNLVELGIFSVMWSEHCSYKSSRLFLKKLPTQAPHVLQGPGENAGVIDIGDGVALAFKMESHNHPSFIEPYQGAATGVGGILRDVFTMGARPIANLNSLRFGDPAHPKTSFLVRGVVSGIAGYGNCMGIPTVGGEVFFDSSYNGNILVNAMTVGILKKEKIFRGTASGPGNPVFYVGSKTGRDGIHGATMASDSFDDASEQKKPTVQVGDPFTEKKLLEACLELMEKDVIVGIQDMGAAGLTSSSIEMAARAGTGIVLDLDTIPLREEGMMPYEMMLSESQERMLFVCKKGCESKAHEVFQKWDLDVCVVGQVTKDQRLRAFFRGEEVLSLPIEPLAHGAPVYDRPRKQPVFLDQAWNFKMDDIPCPVDLNEVFKTLIRHPNQASKKWVYRQYDHQVMTNTIVLPGSDAAVLRIKESQKKIAMTTNCNSRYCYLDPYRGAMIAVAESARNLVCAGARPLALTDCLNFGNPENPEIMWQFEQAVHGIGDACRFLEIPVISGNVSFYNETNGVSIFPTPIIGMVGLIEEATSSLDQFFKNEGDSLFLLGNLTGELGGSGYLAHVHGLTTGRPPTIDLEIEKKLFETLFDLNMKGLLSSAHDVSEGGIALALAECGFGKNPLGVDVTLDFSLRPDALLFGESESCVVISVQSEKKEQVKRIADFYKTPCHFLGRVVPKRFVIHGGALKAGIDLDQALVQEEWEGGFEKGIFRGHL